jgi:hypothetical protein
MKSLLYFVLGMLGGYGYLSAMRFDVAPNPVFVGGAGLLLAVGLLSAGYARKNPRWCLSGWASLGVFVGMAIPVVVFLLAFAG